MSGLTDNFVLPLSLRTVWRSFEGYSSVSNTVLARVQEVFKELFGVNPQSVSLETTAFDVPGWDSVGHLSLCGALEEAFKIRFDANELTEISDGRSIISIIDVKEGPPAEP